MSLHGSGAGAELRLLMPGGAGQAAWKPAALATAAGVAIFVIGITVESLIIRAVHGNRAELEWLSDATVSMAVTGMTYLWLRLRHSRRRVLALEQEQIAVDEQLRLAAEIQRGLLPDLPQVTPGFRWAARMIPASRVGGDFYDFIAMPGALGVVNGDYVDHVTRDNQAASGVALIFVALYARTRVGRPGKICTSRAVASSAAARCSTRSG